MDYVDFQIRAWKSDDAHVHVMAHATPVNTMRQPISVPFERARLNSLSDVFTRYDRRDSPKRIAKAHKLGEVLSRMIFPRPVYALLTASLKHLPSDTGVRVRLCLDEHLLDLPWELVSLPDAVGQEFPFNCAAMDERISIVREAPITQLSVTPSTRKQRLVFAAAMDDAGEDYFYSRAEYDQLARALRPVSALIDIVFVTAAGENIRNALASPCDIFHYSGHTDVIGDRAFLTREVVIGAAKRKGLVPGHIGSKTAATGQEITVDPLFGEQLGAWLQQAGVKLAVFSACNSSQWGFIEPLIRFGAPAVLGAHELLWSDTASDFAGNLYSLLARGVSLDDAVMWASDYLLTHETHDPLAWAQFALYMPSTSAVLFPRPDLQTDRESLRRQRSEDAQPPRAQREWRATDKIALRNVIVQSFSKAELETLCLYVQQALESDQIVVQPALTTENLGGDALPELALNLVNFLDRRGFLGYLRQCIVQERPNALSPGTP